MKIGVISRGRTCSTAVSKTLSLRHNTHDVQEKYFTAHHYLINQTYYKKNLDTQKQLEILEDKLLSLSRSFFTSKKFISKIWPSMLILPPGKIERTQHYSEVKQKIIFDIEKYMFLSKYNKLYFLDRELLYSTLSWVYSKKTGIFQKTKHTNQEYLPITLDENDYAVAKFYILEYCLQQKIKQYLINSNIDFIELSDTQIEYFLDSNLSIEKNIQNYDCLIQDVDRFKKFIEIEYTDCLEATKHWNYY